MSFTSHHHITFIYPRIFRVAFAAMEETGRQETQETGPMVYSPYPRRLERLTVRSKARTLDLPHSRLALY